MDNSRTKTPGIIIGVVLLVIGLVVGVGITKAMDNGDNNGDHTSKSSVSSATKAADLRAALVSKGVEHMILVDQAVDGALDGAPNADATAAALYKNGTDLGAAVGSVYGKDAETTFNKVWKLHLDQFVAYAVASKSGDTAAKQAALNTIDAQYTKPLAQFLAKANPNLSEKTLKTALRDHVDMTAAMIDDHTAGDYTKEATELSMANTHMSDLMSTLAGAIVKQYPDKFQG